MTFEYHFKQNEASFGPPVEHQIEGGMHITTEVILRFEGKLVAIRRTGGIPGHEIPPKAKDYPNGCLYFVHDLIRYGEDFDQYLQRIVDEQAGVKLLKHKVLFIESLVQDKDKQWAFMPIILGDIDRLPSVGDKGILEVVTFTKENVPEDFGWWEKKEIEELFAKF